MRLFERRYVLVVGVPIYLVIEASEVCLSLQLCSAIVSASHYQSLYSCGLAKDVRLILKTRSEYSIAISETHSASWILVVGVEEFCDGLSISTPIQSSTEPTWTAMPYTGAHATWPADDLFGSAPSRLCCIQRDTLTWPIVFRFSLI